MAEKAYVTRKLSLISPTKANIKTKKKTLKKAVQLLNPHKADIKKKQT